MDNKNLLYAAAAFLAAALLLKKKSTPGAVAASRTPPPLPPVQMPVGSGGPQIGIALAQNSGAIAHAFESAFDWARFAASNPSTPDVALATADGSEDAPTDSDFYT